ncbi:N-acetylneuraminate synthase [Paenibacillus oryzisoli]|uniref:N-acetylneuraminate synthase n=1 Tax=Paenibacillus oryzisoli TaxID=1850517 RepID=A0A197ZZ80_9BACL|nr:N-acetylneuraminate synthase [Paenibacillus oryzisoli]OAS14514.1 N-acetylneuraminate synthase [Paenibacillus oryzisoli]
MERTFIVAEAGVNHNGDIELAKRLIEVAADCGADVVKFQTFRSEKLVSKLAEKAGYQKSTTDATENQLNMLKKLELSIEDHHLLIDHCKKNGIMFLSTPFDEDSLYFLAEDLKLPIIKIPSGEITNAPFLLKIARFKKKIILSTGMSSLGEIEHALSILAFGLLHEKGNPSEESIQRSYASVEGHRLLKEYVSILHCTTEYPTPFVEVNLRAMDTLKLAFQLPVGLSDHTEGIAIPIAAVARGAYLIEKHFTLDRTMPGPDHRASLEPQELKAMIHSIRQVEESLGIKIKSATQSEIKNKLVVRKSLVAIKPIQKGEYFTEENIGVKRPGNGVSPIYYWDYIGETAQKDYDEDDLI